MLDDLVGDIQRRSLQLLPELWKLLRPKIDKDLMKALLRLDLVTKSPKQHMSMTAKDLQVRLDSLINVPFKLKAGDKELEDKRLSGHFKKGAGSASLQQAVDKLKQGNRELGIKQMASIHDMLSSDEDSCTTNSKLSGTIGSSGSDKGSSNIAGGHVGKESNLSQLGSNIRGVTSQKEITKEAGPHCPAPRHITRPEKQRCTIIGNRQR